MSKAYLGAFIAIATIAVGAVDYLNQARTAGSAPGRFGMGDYAASISRRLAGQTAPIAGAAEPTAPASAEAGKTDRPDRAEEAPVADAGGAVDTPRATPDAAQSADVADAARRMEMTAAEMMRRAGKTTDADYEAVEAMRPGASAAGLAGGQMAVQSALAVDNLASGETAVAGGGIVGGILGALGFGRADPALAPDTAIEPAGQARRIKVNVFGAGSCKASGLGKRCKVGD